MLNNVITQFFVTGRTNGRAGGLRNDGEQEMTFQLEGGCLIAILARNREYSVNLK